jgi:hypothetical protein
VLVIPACVPNREYIFDGDRVDLSIEPTGEVFFVEPPGVILGPLWATRVFAYAANDVRLSQFPEGRHAGGLDWYRPIDLERVFSRETGLLRDLSPIISASPFAGGLCEDSFARKST